MKVPKLQTHCDGSTILWCIELCTCQLTTNCVPTWTVPGLVSLCLMYRLHGPVQNIEAMHQNMEPVAHFKKIEEDLSSSCKVHVYVLTHFCPHMCGCMYVHTNIS